MLPPPRTPDKRGYSGARGLATLANKFARCSSFWLRRRLWLSPSSTQFDLWGSTSTFGDVYFRPHPRRYSSTRGACHLPSPHTHFIIKIKVNIYLKHHRYLYVDLLAVRALFSIYFVPLGFRMEILVRCTSGRSWGPSSWPRS